METGDKRQPDGPLGLCADFTNLYLPYIGTLYPLCKKNYYFPKVK